MSRALAAVLPAMLDSRELGGWVTKLRHYRQLPWIGGAIMFVTMLVGLGALGLTYGPCPQLGSSTERAGTSLSIGPST